MYNVLARIISFFCKLLSFTYSYEFFDMNNLRQAKKLSPHNNYILGFWHHNALSALTAFRHRPHVVIVSSSTDGTLASVPCESFGNKTVRGSSTRGGMKALIEMIRWVKKGYPGAITIDGPKGPRKEIKEGIFKLSQLTQTPIIPLSLEPESFWSLKKSWDQFRIPKPFTKIKILVGTPIQVLKSHKDLNPYKRKLEHELTQGELYFIKQNNWKTSSTNHSY
jgi:lysophospholipid acyltransferase (LPLAT)-like uncharacterized protein